MATYDAVAGCDQSTLNSIAASIYAQVPQIFSGSVTVNKYNITTVSYSIGAAPTFTLAPSAMAANAYRRALAGRVSEAALENDVAQLAQASFTVSISSLNMVINYSDGTNTTLAASLEGGAQAQTQPNSTLTLTLVSGSLSIPADPDMAKILNEVAVPAIIQYLNQNVLKPITIPPIIVEGISLTAPTVLTANGDLLAFTAMQPSVVTPPTGNTWPANVVFVGVDSALLNAGAAAFVSKLNPNGTWQWSHGIAVCTLSLDASYQVAVTNPQLALNPGVNGQLAGTVSLSAAVSFSAKCGFLNPSFSAKATATPTVVATVGINSANQVVVTFNSLSNVNFNFNFSGVPQFLNSLLSDIANLLSPVMAAAVNAVLGGHSFTVYSIPQINLTLGKIPLTIQLTQMSISTASEGDGSTLAMVTGVPSVTSSTALASVVGPPAERRSTAA